MTDDEVQQRPRTAVETALLGANRERVEAAEATGIALAIHPAVLAWFPR